LSNTTNYNLAKAVQGQQTWHIESNKNLDIIDDALSKKVQTSTFTAKSNGISKIVHGFTNYDPLHDKIEAIYENYNLVLTKNVNYIENADETISLTDWSLKMGETISFNIFRKIK